MSTFESIMIAILIALLLFFLFKRIKNQPEAFSKANLSQSATVLGILALGLIGFIAILIALLRSSS